MPGSRLFQPLVDPAAPTEDLLEALREAVDLTRGLLAECRVRLEGIVEKEGFEKNKAIADAKEAVNAYDERTGLPSDHYTDADVEALSEHVFCHIFVQYPDGVDARIH